MEQYVYPTTFKVASYGKAFVPVVCNVDKSTKKISFHSYGQYTVSQNSGMSINMKSRTCKNSSDGIILKVSFTGTNVNTHEESTLYNFDKKITYDDIKKHYNF